MLSEPVMDNQQLKYTLIIVYNLRLKSRNILINILVLIKV